MIRKALLIEAGKARGQSVLPGPAIDVARLRTWFINNDGGAWEDAEILTLSNPSKSTVQAAVAGLAGSDYAFVSFSGHGFIDKDTRTGRQTQMVTLGSGEEMAFDLLRPQVPRCMMTCDACREVVERPVMLSHAAFNERRLKSVRESYRRPDYRKAFDLAVGRAAEGAFKMYGCAEGQYCYEDAINGGFFTSALIDTAAEWVDRSSTRSALAASVSLQLTYTAVSTMTAGRKPPQYPRGGPENRTLGNDYPFAVALI